MENILLYISSFLILFSYVGYLLLIYMNNKKISDDSCLGIFTDLLSEYNGINIILSKGIFSYYNIQRKIIKLNEKCYYGNTVNYFSISLIEVGYFINDKLGNKFIDLCRKIIPTLKILYLLPFVSVFISNSTYGLNDSIIGIILISIFICIAFLILNIKKQIYLWITENNRVKKLDCFDDILNFIRKNIMLEWVIIFAEFIILFRFLLIIML